MTLERARRGHGERGQILVLFTLCAVAIIAMVGLVVDGGSTFAQRRNQQNAADLAALAAADTFLLTNLESLSTAAATSTAASNGFTHGSGGTAVTVTYNYSHGVTVTVGVAASHPNAFTPAIGIQSWEVSTKASAQAGFPDTGVG
ncbi:MAG TPA: pilus assembly protein TadG-related protein, partial [Candidatus Limnocylindrales bacterium]